MLPLHDDEIEIDDELVAALVRSQMPEFVSRPLRRLAGSGTDNPPQTTTFTPPSRRHMHQLSESASIGRFGR